MLNIPTGWLFNSSDCSVYAQDPTRKNGCTVMLIRDKLGRDWWHSLSDEDKENEELYAHGIGDTFEDALTAANINAIAALYSKLP